MKPLLAVLGIDPGLGVSHGAVVAQTEDGPRVVSTFTWETPETGRLGELCVPVSARPTAVVAALIENARGQIIKGRAHDPVLRDAHMSGRLQEEVQDCYPLLPVITAPAFGSEQGWNWRGEIGCNGMTDVGIRLHLERHLRATFPVGKRGAQISHFVDAAGIAWAGLNRLVTRGVTLDNSDYPAVHHALTDLSPLEAAVKEGVGERRTARRQGRALNKRYAS